MSMVSGTLWFILVLWNKNRLSKLMKTIVSEYYAFRKRNIDLIKYSSEQYYLQMIEEYGITLNYIPLKDIASYLGITPQALSRIRKRIF